jgi:hypothetical protein
MSVGMTALGRSKAAISSVLGIVRSLPGRRSRHGIADKLSHQSLRPRIPRLTRGALPPQQRLGIDSNEPGRVDPAMPALAATRSQLRAEQKGNETMPIRFR